MKRPSITFDTNIPAEASVRAFWGALCEDLNQRMLLTPTAAAELLVRVRLDAEREWARRLRRAAPAPRAEPAQRAAAGQPGGWTRRGIRRLSTAAAVAARDRLREEMRRPGAIYAVTPPADAKVEALEGELDAVLPDDCFDLSTGNGVRDRKIVIEAFARGFDVLASNNIHSIDHELLGEWVQGEGGRRLGLACRILRPQQAESRLRRAYGRPLEWTAHALARAAVTDPEQREQAAQEMVEGLARFAARGMGELQKRIERMLSDARTFDAALASVRRHGSSKARRANLRIGEAASEAVARAGGPLP